MNALRITTRHICQKVLICNEKDLYSVYFKEMNLFEKIGFLKKCSFSQPAELFPSSSQLREEKEHLFQQAKLHNIHITWCMGKLYHLVEL